MLKGLGADADVSINLEVAIQGPPTTDPPMLSRLPQVSKFGLNVQPLSIRSCRTQNKSQSSVIMKFLYEYMPFI